MPANYLHGIETVEITKGPRPIQIVKSAVIALVGSAPSGPVNVPTLVLSDKDAAKFADMTGRPAGDALNNYTLPAALDGILDQGAGVVVVINIFNPALHTATGEAGKTAIAASDLIGGVDPATNARKGLAALANFFTLFGFTPKIICCPGWSSSAAVATEMLSRAQAHRAVALIDGTAGITVPQAIANRAVTSSNFDTSSERALLLYPGCTIYDAATGTTRVEGLSARVAGLISRVDQEEGYWVSPSNHELRGVVGMETPISAGINDATTEANLLNEKGITTLFNSFGTGIRLWGNRTAAWPSVTHPKNFLNVRRVADILQESVEWSMLQFLDQPINDVLIDSIKASVDGFIRTLVMRGALVDGKCTYDPAKNPVTEIALGHILFDIEFMPPTPAERITFESFINIDLLRSLGGGNS